jgi:pimeloyl-ACP methyl ester carboxylesterase
MTGEESEHTHSQRIRNVIARITGIAARWRVRLLVFGCVFLSVLVISVLVSFKHHKNAIIPIEEAQEHLLDIGNGLQIWYRVWGVASGIPVLFVHGGPGNAVADYYNGNARFFSKDKFWVIEVDQRGTGNSQPSVRENWKNMAYYKDISIDKMCADFELVREAMGIKQWLVWGGSFGSTLGINYGTRYPERSLALILRGIYLDTPVEVEAVYSRKVHEDNPKRLAEYDGLYNYAADYLSAEGEDPLDPNDAEGLLLVYERMIQKGNRKAIWHWHVFE